ncbi:MAG TPA: hypothetical protein VJP85_03495 [Candidatus Baltobacteraceae bacterium]|nr:hypothetical protein [Candidatus Baltobacteraceae bacterium]
MKLPALSLAPVFALCACGGGSGAQHAATPQPSLAPLISSRGVTMPLEQAVHELTFAPFIPAAQIAGIAIVPPLSDDEDKRDPGIAIEYKSEGDTLLLSQWPRTKIEIAVGSFDATRRPCAPVAYKPDGLLWTTRDGRVMTLQPDGAVAPARIAREVDRLLRAGACQRRTGATLSRPLPSRRTPSVFSPRRSAS